MGIEEIKMVYKCADSFTHQSGWFYGPEIYTANQNSV